jgi:hypothetical protein
MSANTLNESRDVWINGNGRVVCIAHGGQELQFAVARRSTRAATINTPLDHWMLFQESEEIQCEDCGAPGSLEWELAQRYVPPTAEHLAALAKLWD